MLGVLTRTEISNEQHFGVLKANKWRAMQAYFNERAHFDRACAILDSNSGEAWGEGKSDLGSRSEAE